MSIPVQLTDDEAQALLQAMQREHRAQQDADAARLQLVWRDAVDAKNAILAQLATTHGFDVGVPLQFDPKTNTLSSNGNGRG